MNDQPHGVLCGARRRSRILGVCSPTSATLVDEAPDTMALHTREAYRLFVGRSLDVAQQREPHRWWPPGRGRAAGDLVPVGQRQPVRGLGAGRHR